MRISFDQNCISLNCCNIRFFTTSLLQRFCASHGAADALVSPCELRPRGRGCCLLRGLQGSRPLVFSASHYTDRISHVHVFFSFVKGQVVRGTGGLCTRVLNLTLQVMVRSAAPSWLILLFIFDNSGEKKFNKPSLVPGTHKLECFSALKWKWHSSPPPATVLYSVGSAIEIGQSVDSGEGREEAGMSVKDRHSWDEAGGADATARRDSRLVARLQASWLQHFTTFFTMNVRYNLIFITGFRAICSRCPFC